MERALEELVRRRAGGRCEYCQVPQSHDRMPFEIDHVIARKHRGPTRAGNKGPNVAGVDPESGRVVPLFNPRRHNWSRHFRWQGPVLVGRTPAGRATVAVLEVNLPYRVSFRRGLMDEGVFPPPD